MAKKIFVVPIEPIDQRYTAQWFTFIPEWLHKETGYEVVNVEGSVDASSTTKGAFLDFGATNAYKASQVIKIAELFSSGEVKAGDHFLVTDAWNFVVTAIKYMSQLLDIPVVLHGIWHAGNYDPSDILGMKMDIRWASNQERAWFFCCDFNYYASEFHRNMFLTNLFGDAEKYGERAIRSGQPHGMIMEFMDSLPRAPKENIIMWPHRYNSDKQPEIAEDIAKEFNVIITQKMNLSKEDYYKTMLRSKIIFSCALHENLGISMMEGLLADAIPLMPDRCSYKEMYLPAFKYPTIWTASYEDYMQHRDKVLGKIDELLRAYNDLSEKMYIQKELIREKYLTATEMLLKIKE